MTLYSAITKAIPNNKIIALRGDNLKARCARSSIVLGVGAIIAKGSGFASKVILTRLLVPEVMGLMVLILSITALLTVLTEIGIKQSVIQNKNGARLEFLNMAWCFQSLRGIGLYAIGFFVAPLLCRFYFADKPEIVTLYSMPELVALVRTAFLVFLFGGIVSPQVHVLEKQFRFGKAVFLNQGSTVLGSVVTIVLAFAMRNIWAVIIGFISMSVLRSLFSYILCPFRPRLSFDRPSFKEISKFARGMLGLPFLTYIAFNIDILVAGKMVSADLVGMYGMALVLALAPQDLFNRIIRPVLLPAFAEKQDHREALCIAIVKLTKFTALFGLPLVALAIVCSKTILSLVFGEQYSAVAVPFSLLCIYALLLIIGTILGNVLFSIGQPAKHRLFVGLRALILIVFIYPAVRLFGLTGAAAIVLLASFIAMCAQVVVMHKTIQLKIFDYVISWIPGLALALPVLVIIWLLQYFSPG
ncbi:MAG: oligosaccharide flippase family protein [Planctomycetota bacterium]|nr:MAG: oligosaccharide flippase family protein [Planctomycetota bacterium]